MAHYLSDNNFEESLRVANVLQQRYYKILKVNLDDMTYEVIKDTSEDMYHHYDLIKWWNIFLKGYVHPDDSDRCQYFMRHFKDEDSVYYRRKYSKSSEYKWGFTQKVMYGNDCYLLVRGLDSNCSNALIDKYIAEEAAYLDPAYDCYTFNKFKKDRSKNSLDDEYTLLYMRISKIKELNSSVGVDKANDIVSSCVELFNKYFGKDNIYHIIGLEFLIYVEGDKLAFKKPLSLAYKGIKDMGLDLIATYTNHKPQESHIEDTFTRAKNQLDVLINKRKNE